MGAVGIVWCPMMFLDVAAGEEHHVVVVVSSLDEVYEDHGREWVIRVRGDRHRHFATSKSRIILLSFVNKLCDVPDHIFRHDDDEEEKPKDWHSLAGSFKRKKNPEGNSKWMDGMTSGMVE